MESTVDHFAPPSPSEAIQQVATIFARAYLRHRGKVLTATAPTCLEVRRETVLSVPTGLPSRESGRKPHVSGTGD